MMMIVLGSGVSRLSPMIVLICLLPVPQAEHSSTIHTRKVAGSLVISFLFVLREPSKRFLPLSEQLPTIRGAQRDIMLGKDLLPSARVPNNHKNCNKRAVL